MEIHHENGRVNWTNCDTTVPDNQKRGINEYRNRFIKYIAEKLGLTVRIQIDNNPQNDIIVNKKSLDKFIERNKTVADDTLNELPTLLKERITALKPKPQQPEAPVAAAPPKTKVQEELEKRLEEEQANLMNMMRDLINKKDEPKKAPEEPSEKRQVKRTHGGRTKKRTK